jgi:spore coat polysaccharide biosynthesis protein SpsF
MITPIWNNYTILQLIIHRLKINFPDNKIYILTTTNKADDELIDSIKDYPVTIFRGDEMDVLSRFVQAGHLFNETEFIRICGDNPFLLPEFLNVLLKTDLNTEYTSFSFGNVPAMKCHFGLFAERVQLKALEKAQQLASDIIYHEHVTNYVYEHPELFNVYFHDVTEQLKKINNIRLTVDTIEDFETVAFLLDKFKDPFQLKLYEIIDIIKQFPELENKMTMEIKRNTK